MVNRKNFRECPRCGAHYKILSLPSKNGVARYETERQAFDRHVSGTKCQARVISAFAEINGWALVGQSAYAAKNASFEVVYLPTTLAHEHKSGLVPSPWSKKEVSEAGSLLSKVRASGEERRKWLQCLVVDEELRGAVSAVRRLAGPEAVRRLLLGGAPLSKEE